LSKIVKLNNKTPQPTLLQAMPMYHNHHHPRYQQNEDLQTFTFLQRCK